MQAAFLRVYLQRKGHTVTVAYERGLAALFNIEELRGESRVDWFSSVCSTVMRDRNML